MWGAEILFFTNIQKKFVVVTFVLFFDSCVFYFS